jgi:hypothetical protein
MVPVSQILGWIGVITTVVISSFWAFWGANENFHEGWYSESLRENLLMLIFQYMLFTILFVVLALISLQWPLAGLILYLLTGVFCIRFFSGASFSVIGLFALIPFAALGLLFYFGRPQPIEWACFIIIFIPVIIFAVITIPQGIKVSKRIDDKNYGARTVAGNGITLVWAPEGPGWPDRGVGWHEAQDICRRLSEDGLHLMDTEQNYWRLPTADEAVRSMMRHGVNSGGRLEGGHNTAVYSKKPDKETPLWKKHSKIIYYWTADSSSANNKKAYIIVFHGGVYEKMKEDRSGSLSFRAVKKPES